ncbi:MAG: FG-GAP-like repeat-containing protein, partial [Thermoanaerobaculia bacterium]
MKRLARLLLLTVLLGCGQSTADERAASPTDAATREMVARLAALSLAEDVNEELVSTPEFAVNQPHLIPRLRARIAASEDAMQRLQLRAELAGQLLMDGASNEALAEAETLATEMAASELLPADQKRRALFDVQGLIALAALRIGEQENCIARHGRHSCLFPIDRGGVHEIRRGSERALPALGRQLEVEPRDLSARWLLNLAQMTLDNYPEGLEKRLLLPPVLFASERPIARFEDVAPALGIAVIGLAGGSVLEDFNGDDLLDLVVSSWGLRDQLRYFQNTGSGFVERTREAGLLGLVGGINLTHADFDNDGDADLWVLRGGWLADLGEHPNSLLRNNGDGTFSDVTHAAGLLALEPSHSAAWGDFNNDGWLDLFVAHEERPNGNPHPCRLYVSNRDGTFSHYAEFADMGVVKGVAWGDYNNDGWLDLFLSRFGRSNALYRSDPVLDQESRPVPGLRRFTDVTAEAGVAEPRLSFPTWFFDYDNDGWSDLFVAAWDGSEIGEIAAQHLGAPNEAEVPRLFRNKGDGRFED